MADADLYLRLEQLAAEADSRTEWPEQSWKLLGELEGYRWAIPSEYGGLGCDAVQLLENYERLAASCLTTCFILTQRDAACRRIVMGENAALRQRLLPGLAAGAEFVTVGLSHLTTSRQHVGPTFTAEQVEGGFLLNGHIPWVSGASRAEHIVIGATLADRSQVLLVLPKRLPGVSIGAPSELMALAGSITAEVTCRNVFLEHGWLLDGPRDAIMQGRQGGAGGLQTSCLALGLARAAIAFLQREASHRPNLRDGTERLEARRQRCRSLLYRLAAGGGSKEEILSLRAQANSLVVQASQAALIAAKGTGFLRSHPAQRWVRQAMFFLVWSCPWPAASATLDLLTLAPSEECL